MKAVIFDMFETLITHYESPLYFGEHMAADLGLPEQKFREIWDAADEDRTLGKTTLEEVVRSIMDANGLHDDELFAKVVEKRKAAKEDCFRHVNKDIVPMLEAIRSKGIKTGLITNCFSEEAPLIKDSELFKYFDVALLSFEQGLQKPDRRIFEKCVKELGVDPQECIYVGDGGSHELEAASEIGMKPLQALWYLKKGSRQKLVEKEGFEHIYNPMDVVKIVEKAK